MNEYSILFSNIWLNQRVAEPNDHALNIFPSYSEVANRIRLDFKLLIKF